MFYRGEKTVVFLVSIATQIDGAFDILQRRDLTPRSSYLFSTRTASRPPCLNTLPHIARPAYESGSRGGRGWSTYEMDVTIMS
jgi:hypothetical protein